MAGGKFDATPSSEWPELRFIDTGSPEIAAELAAKLNAGEAVWKALVEACRLLEEGAQKEIFTVPAVAAAHHIIREILERYAINTPDAMSGYRAEGDKSG